LEEEWCPGAAPGHTISCSSRDGGNGALRDPSKSFWQENIRSIKVYDTVSESVSDCLCGPKKVFDSSVPIENSRVKTEPGGAELIDLCNSPTKGGLKGSYTASIVRTMNPTLAFVSPGEFPPDLLRVIRVSPDPLAVEVVDVNALEEGPLEGRLVRLPRYHLGVRPGEVDVEQDVLRVRKEGPPDVGEGLHW